MRAARRLGGAAILLLILQAGAAAQIMRFDTSVGSFDMELNPTNDPNLQRLVDNIVAYIGLGRYHYTAINRADEGFVLQMGSFLGFPPTQEDFLGLVQEIRRLDPVVVDSDGDRTVDFTTQSNTRGTVSLALGADQQGTLPNSGTSSFFINVGDNSNLDSQGFVPFARIVDMTTVDRIMDLEQTNLSGDENDLTFGDVPLQENGRLVILERVRVLQAAPTFSFVGPVAAALQQIQADAVAPPAAAAIVAASSAAASAVPEPSSLALLGIAALGLSRRRVRR